MRYIIKRLGLSLLLLLFIYFIRLLATEVTAPTSLQPSCLFFTETGGGLGGYSVCDDTHADFRTAFEQWGLGQVGYPISRRYTHDRFVRQAFQKVIMEWQPKAARVTFVNIFDELHQAGFDKLLLDLYSVPLPLPDGSHKSHVLGDLPLDQIIKKRQKLLDQRPALRKLYFASDDPLLFYGLPTSEVLDLGNHYAIRLQRALLQEWKEEVSWAKAGDVTVANAGDIAKELGTLPELALIPEPEAPSLTPLPIGSIQSATPLAESPPINTPQSASRLDASAFSLALEPIMTGFIRPLAVVTPGDGSGRLFMVEKDGLIWLLVNATDPKQQALKGSTPFLDVSPLISTANESGLLGMVFEPGHARFYINYINSEGESVLARYQMSADSYTADPASAEILLTIPQVDPNHNGGNLLFGPDGYLWLALGDGGGFEDEAGNAQNPNTLLGSILRLDVRSETGYTIPPDNPVGDEFKRPEVWAIGLRNPWRYSFDRMTGDLWLGDVGQASWEEINRVPSTQPALNYGWPITEGNHCLKEENCVTDGFVVPITEYDHSAGCAVTGGYVYRGNQYPQLQGIYLFGDHCNGNLWAIYANTQTPVEPTLILESGVQIASFGEDEAGELYVVGFDGTLYRLVAQ